MFEGLKIPRAHAAPASGSSSGSDAALISGGDTLPSDYPSESPSSAHSEVEDIDTRSLHRSVSSHGSYDNKAFIHHEASSVYSEGYGQHTETEIMTAAAVHRKPPPPEPKFDVQVRVKRAPPPPPSPTPPPSESEASMKMQERNLTTILEREEIVRQVPKSNIQTFTYVPELHPPPPPAKVSPPIYSKVMRKQPMKIVEETWTQEDTVDMMRRRPSLSSLNTEMTDTRSMSEIVERSHQRRAPPPPPVAPQMYSSSMEITSTEVVEPPVVISPRPQITSHVVDDVFLRTITEKRTIEDIERHRRQITEYHQKPQPPPPNWDVTIRNYPNPDGHPSGDEGTTDWDSFSETSSLSSYPTPQPERHRAQHHRNEVDIHQSYRSTLEIPIQDPSVRNWDVLIRVLEPPPQEPTQEHHHETYRVEQTLTLEDRKKWREIITTESTLRTLLTEATVKEDFERIRKDQRYEKIFEPQKWDVIIRVLAPPEKPLYDQKGAPGNNKYRRKADWDTRSRRSSLPTLYEYDSDGGSSVRTLTADVGGPPGVDPMRSRRTSRSSFRSDMDVRSMSEVTVDFAQRNMPDNMSDASSYYRPRRYYDDDYLLRPGTASEDEDGVSLVRSVSQPSLARSASEFTEHQWGVRGRQWDMSSPEHSPRSGRSQRVSGGAAMSSSYSVRQSTFQQSQGWFGDADSEASYK